MGPLIVVFLLGLSVGVFGINFLHRKLLAEVNLLLDTRHDSENLTDLRERLAEKQAVLVRMSNVDGLFLHTHLRLKGKAEGVALAISFVDEHLRRGWR